MTDDKLKTMEQEATEAVTNYEWPAGVDVKVIGAGNVYIGDMEWPAVRFLVECPEGMQDEISDKLEYLTGGMSMYIAYASSKEG